MDLATVEPPAIGDVEAAARRLDGRALLTPLLWSPSLDALAGRRVLVKAECLQLTGSFKFRGGLQRRLRPAGGGAGARRDRLLLGQPRSGRGAGRAGCTAFGP